MSVIVVEVVVNGQRVERRFEVTEPYLMACRDELRAAQRLIDGPVGSSYVANRDAYLLAQARRLEIEKLAVVSIVKEGKKEGGS
jgi:hypothetical protein